jgi:hypothetical protein
MKRKFLAKAFCLFAAVILAGCATSRINWDARVGNYSYDQAVLELGPPDKAAKLTDGTTVGEWLTGRGGGYSNFMYGPYYGYPIYEPPTPDRFLRLTFDPQGKLRDWKRVYR